MRCFAGIHNRIFHGMILVVLFGHTPAFCQRLTQSAARSAETIEPPSVRTTAGPVIPGLREGAIPQGIAFASANRKILISHYFEQASARISVLDASTGNMTACVTLQTPSGQPHQGHVGGITIIKDSVFVASDGQLLQYRLEDFVSPASTEDAQATAVGTSETRADFCTASPDFLLVGEFAHGIRFPTDSSHHVRDRKGIRKYAWVCGYDADDPFGGPQCVLSVRQKVQGMCVAGDHVYLSVSYGRKNRSRIVIYRNPIGDAAHRLVRIRDGSEIPLWFLDGVNYIGEIDFPPMSEGLVMIDGQLAVLSESGADKYQPGGKGPLDRIMLLDVSGFRTQ